jgi:GAF domain-containing protein
VSADGDHPQFTGVWPLGEGSLAARIRTTRQPAREDNWASVPGRIGEIVRTVLGVRSTVASPIVVDGAVWGGLYVHTRSPQHPLPRDTEVRLESFGELVATAISNARARAAARRLADQQAALRRVATLVAREAPADEILTAVAEEVVRILGVDDARIIRYDAGDMVTIAANFGRLATQVPVGLRARAEGENVTTMVLRTGRSARKDYHDDATGAHRRSDPASRDPVVGRRPDLRGWPALGRHAGSVAVGRAPPA